MEDGKYIYRIKKKIVYSRNMHNITAEISMMKHILLKYRDVIYRDINELSYLPICMSDMKDEFHLGYLPNLLYIRIPRSKVVASDNFIEGFIEAAYRESNYYREFELIF